MEKPPLLIICRAGFESDVASELGAGARRVAPGVVAAPANARESVFERQRMLSPHFTPVGELKPISDATLEAVMGPVIATTTPFRYHAYVPAGDSQPDLVRRIDGIAGTLLRLAGKRAPGIEDRVHDEADTVVQLCLTPEGLWSATHAAEDLTSSYVGGEFRMRMDRDAPSRSYLKMEEAFARMGREPSTGQRVIDLGAAPGGWTYACVRRGANVLAVDSGPMRLPPRQPGWGDMHHIRANGIVFEPPDRRPVDWLVADMLVAPGVALGLLRRWMTQRMTTNLVVNAKIPQSDAYRAIAPILQFLDSQRRDWRSMVKQLYHDRREVTVLAYRPETAAQRQGR